jgi:prophage regulatory protein
MNEVKHSPAIVWQGLMAAKTITKAVNISRAHLYNMLARGLFPKPVLRCGPRFTRWKASDVQAWLADPQGWIAANGKATQDEGG